MHSRHTADELTPCDHHKSLRSRVLEARKTLLPPAAWVDASAKATRSATRSPLSKRHTTRVSRHTCQRDVRPAPPTGHRAKVTRPSSRRGHGSAGDVGPSTGGPSSEAAAAALDFADRCWKRQSEPAQASVGRCRASATGSLGPGRRGTEARLGVTGHSRRTQVGTRRGNSVDTQGHSVDALLRHSRKTLEEDTRWTLEERRWGGLTRSRLSWQDFASPEMELGVTWLASCRV